MGVKFLPVRVTTPEALLEFKIKRGATGNWLFNQVCVTIGLREAWYFGLQYTNEKNVTKWVKLNEKISPTSKMKNQPLEYILKVKFFPEDPYDELIEEVTQKLFYLQLKSDLISGRIYCSSEVALLLASYQAVVRHGSYSCLTETTGYLNIPSYIPEHILNQYNLTHEDWESKIASLHKQHEDMTAHEAMMQYLKNIKEVDMFGVTYFSIKNNKQTRLWLGVDALGLNIYEESDRLTPKISFPWYETRKLQYNHSKFTVKPADTSAKDLVFYCDRTSLCKEVLALCTANHELYRRRREPDTIEVQQMKMQAKEAKDVRTAERNRLLAERREKELMEERYRKLERAMQEQEMAYELSKSNLSEYQQKVEALEAQLEEEIRLRRNLEEVRLQLEDVNRRLEEETVISLEEQQRLAADRDRFASEIKRREEALRLQQEQKDMLQQELIKSKAQEEMNGGNTISSGEQDLPSLDGLKQMELDRQAMTTTNIDHAKRLEMMRKDLNAARDESKLTDIDIRYEKNLAEGLDKYRTLHAIRQGNTKKRVEQFEAM